MLAAFSHLFHLEVLEVWPDTLEDCPMVYTLTLWQYTCCLHEHYTTFTSEIFQNIVLKSSDFLTILFCNLKKRNLWSNRWRSSGLWQLIQAKSLYGNKALWFSAIYLSPCYYLHWSHLYFERQPNLSASWLFQRAMSAKQQLDVSPGFTNELLHVNFSCMQV